MPLQDMTLPDSVAFSIFGKNIYWYGVLIAVGILLSVVLASIEAKRKRFYKDVVLDLCLWVIPLGVIGARLYYVLFELEDYLANPIEILYLWEGGLAIWGAVIFGLLGAFIFSRIKKIRFLALGDLIAPGLVLAQALGRWGNFFNQEAYGPAVKDVAMQWFPYAVKIEGVHYFNGEICECVAHAHMATFFYESLWCLIVFLIIWLLRKRMKHDGDMLLTYVMLYSFERMLVESLRGDSLWLIKPGVWEILPWGIRVSQALSAVLFIGVLIFFIVRHLKEKKLGRLIWPARLAVIGAEDEEHKAEAVDAAIDQLGDEEDTTSFVETDENIEN